MLISNNLKYSVQKPKRTSSQSKHKTQITGFHLNNFGFKNIFNRIDSKT